MFLDDYIENLDNVPLEVRERFQEIRKLDDENKQALEDYEHRCNEYLVRTAKSGSAAEKDEARKRIEMIAAGMRERSKEKIRLADKMHAIMKKNEEHLSKEAESFRCELEADNPGAARLIEHRFGLAMSNYKPLRNEKKKRGRKPGPANRTVLSGANNLPNDIFRFNGIDAIDDYSNGAWNLQNGRMENGHHGRDENVPRRISPGMTMASIREQTRRDRSVSRSRGSRGSTPASKAGSLVNGGVNPANPTLLMNAPESRHGRPRKLTSRAQEMIINRLENRVGRPPGSGSGSSIASRIEQILHSPNGPEPMRVDDNGVAVPPTATGDEVEDSDHRTWCFCNHKSYGEMVACDGKSCPYEWFHYRCVNISEPPKGTWLCAYCTQQAAIVAMAKNLSNGGGDSAPPPPSPAGPPVAPPSAEPTA